MVGSSGPAFHLGPEPHAVHRPGDQEEMGGLQGDTQSGQDVEGRCRQTETRQKHVGREESITMETTCTEVVPCLGQDSTRDAGQTEASTGGESKLGYSLY